MTIQEKAILKLFKESIEYWSLTNSKEDEYEWKAFRTAFEAIGGNRGLCMRISIPYIKETLRTKALVLSRKLYSTHTK